MKAATLNQKNYKLQIREVLRPVILESDVLIKLKAAALNHHELWTLQEKNLRSNTDIIMGSDGAGLIIEVGDAVDNFKIGDEIVINPSINWGSNNRVHGEKYEILGFPTHPTTWSSGWQRFRRPSVRFRPSGSLRSTSGRARCWCKGCCLIGFPG